ncbi:MAG: AMP-binding protein, partial [Corynebacterium camporealensis]|uniref:AMP-binding protein n=1 Tax=Corynebacterium camporealensis TaxID=161896 RepID=UPI002A9098EB
MAINVSELSFQAKALARFVPSLVNSGIVGPHGGPKAMINLLPVLARYRFTTARELEQGYLTCPDRLALIDDDGTLTYRQLRNQTRTFARYLQSLDLPEIKLGIMARNGRGIIEPLGAKGYTGGSVYMLNIGSSPEQLAGCIKETGINVLVIDDEFLPRLNEEFYDSL